MKKKKKYTVEKPLQSVVKVSHQLIMFVL